ncbi:MAG: MFS transporter [Oscillospiraceae bacterium]|nr:MFS transporter [Oscillospiraceae bacterium]
MKLNTKRTVLVGFAFFLILLFWQAYDATIALTLTNKFGMNQTWSGVIMALDNILALFLLPLFGALSDKHKGKRGRRTPFIRIGTIVAACALVVLSFVDNAQLKQIHDVSTVDDPAALEIIYDTQGDKTLKTPAGTEFVLTQKFEKEDFVAIRSSDDVADVTNQDEDATPYTSYVVPARQAYAADQTKANPVPLILFVGILLVLLVSMGVFRSPAVALMPDITIKPLRSKANAIINLMGNAGGIVVLLLGMGFAFGISKAENAMMSYTPYYLVIAGIMIAALIIFLTTVKEKEWAAQMQSDSIRYGIEEQEEVPGEKRKLGKKEKLSLIFILASVALWYFGYNAVTSKYSVYAPNVLLMDYSMTMLIAQGAAIVAYLPAGMVASKIGRKKTILSGVLMLALSFGVAAFMRPGSPEWLMYIMFALAGIAWATINVNSFPMVVELCSGSDVGKYTGFYYTASMAAQTATPMLSGLLMDQLGMTTLFPYATIFVALAFVTMLFVTHGDSKE